MNTDERMALIQKLSNLVPEQLDQIILSLEPPAGVIPHFPAPQVQRVSKLLEWAKSPTGCGLNKVKEVLDSIAPPEPTVTRIDGDLNPINGKAPPPVPPNPIEILYYILTRLKKFLNIKTVLLVVLTLLGVSLPIALYITITPTPACELKPEDEWLSCGDKSITNLDLDEVDKTEGTKAYKRKDYDVSVSFFEKAWEKTKDAETLIYLNNAKLYSKREGVNKDKIFTIAVVIPHDTSETIENTKYLSKNILEGVAKKQDEFNKHSTDWKLQILIANDYNGNSPNDPEHIEKLANKLVKRDIIAVMGHYSSRVTMGVKSIYEKHKIVLLSAYSASSNLTNGGDDTFFFRLVNTTEHQSQVLAEYLKDKGYKKLALFAIHRKKEEFYNPSKKFDFSNAFHLDFKAQWLSFGSDYEIVYDPDLTDKDEVTEQLKNAKQKQAEAIVLCPDVDEDIILRAKEVIAENQNKLLITGCSVLNHQYYSDINPWYYHKLIISAWHDDPTVIDSYQKFWNVDYQKKYLGQYDVSRYALSYNAIQVLIDAINQSLKKGTKPSSSDLQKILTDPTFKTQGLNVDETISFRGSERAEKRIKIVKPDCPDPNSNDGCKWIDVDSPLSQDKN